MRQRPRPSGRREVRPSPPAWASLGWQRKIPNDPGERGQQDEPNHARCSYSTSSPHAACQPETYKNMVRLYLHSLHSYDGRPLQSKALEEHQIEDSSPTCAVLIHRHAMSCIPDIGRICRSLHFHRWNLRVAGRDQLISLGMLDHVGPCWTMLDHGPQCILNTSKTPHLEALSMKLHCEDATLLNRISFS